MLTFLFRSKNTPFDKLPKFEMADRAFLYNKTLGSEAQSSEDLPPSS